MKKDLLVYAIDDSKFQLDILKSGVKKFKDEDYTISLSVFSTFLDLQIAMSEKVPDCCIVDLIMPYISGIYVLEWIDRFHPTVFKFVNSSCNEQEYQIMASYRYNAPFLNKDDDVDSRLKYLVGVISGKIRYSSDDCICSR